MGGYFLLVGIEAAINLPTLTFKLASLSFVPSFAPVWLAIVVVAVEVLGGTALVAGYQTSAAAAVLAVYTVVAAFAFVDFSSDLQQTLFLQHMAIIGGLLFISASSAIGNTKTRTR